MQLKLHMVTMEDPAPEEHFLRKLEAMLDLSFVYREIKHLYSRRYWRPPIATRWCWSNTFWWALCSKTI